VTSTRDKKLTSGDLTRDFQVGFDLEGPEVMTSTRDKLTSRDLARDFKVCSDLEGPEVTEMTSTRDKTHLRRLGT
jgi:hypothetical protein